MIRIDRHPRAERDLIDIWFYTLDQWGEAKADEYLREINSAIERLNENPGLGADYGDVCVGVRRYCVRRHRVFYRVDAESLTIIRVLHERMDIYDHVAKGETDG